MTACVGTNHGVYRTIAVWYETIKEHRRTDMSLDGRTRKVSGAKLRRFCRSPVITNACRFLADFWHISGIRFLPEFSDLTSLACVVVVVVHMHPLIIPATDIVRNTRRLGEIWSVGDHLSWLPKCRDAASCPRGATRTAFSLGKSHNAPGCDL